ncbi:BREX system Lon protease-like protein BrxL [Lachnospiraceae bacterium 54-53]
MSDFDINENDTIMDEKLRNCFDQMVVFKDLKKSNFISSFKLPSFMRDWVIKRFQDDDGKLDIEGATNFIKEFIPKKEDWKSIKDRVVNRHEQVKFLAKVSIDIDIRSGEIAFSLPDFGLGYKKTVIPRNVWEVYGDALLKAEENWGIVELGYQFPEDKNSGKIKLMSFKDFCPYSVDLNDFKYAREEFSLDEWIDVILGAIDYNAMGYENKNQKLAMITRLLPFVEKRLNLIELAPKGTGKSYLFGQISRFGWLSSGGTMSRAKMFYDISKHQEGLVFGHDYVALDEVQTIKFTDIDEMRGVLKGYMENGKYTVANHEGSADSGIILLGNINANNMNEYQNMFVDLPAVFHESALIDRFHGFLRGWDLPRMTDDLKICGWALNSEYFTTIMHALRDDPSYRAIVDALVEVPEKSDTRDTEAIKRLATAYLKLLFPNVRKPEDILAREFNLYCLRPALEMRGIIKIQLSILDPEEFGGKPIPSLTVKDLW